MRSARDAKPGVCGGEGTARGARWARRLALGGTLGIVAGCAQDSAAAAAIDSACLSPGAWYALGDPRPRERAEGVLLGEIARREVVLLGESHDDPDHHRWQLQVLAALHTLHPRMAIGFESFPRRVQPVLDLWVAGKLSQKEFLEQSTWDKVWNMPAELYLPLMHFARLNRIPMLALNVERELTQQISRRGWDAVPAEKKEGVSRPAPARDAYRAQLLEIFTQHRRVKDRNAAPVRLDDREFLNFVDSQTTWDRAMAEALARARGLGRGDAPLVVAILGAGHVRHGHGVAHQLRDLGISRIASLLAVDAGSDCAELPAGLADAVFALPALPGDAAPPPRVGVRLEQVQEGVDITEVVAGSLAEASGLRKGDRIVSLGGVPVKQIAAVVAALRAPTDGTWLPIQLQRSGQTLELLIKYPPREGPHRGARASSKAPAPARPGQ